MPSFRTALAMALLGICAPRLALAAIPCSPTPSGNCVTNGDFETGVLAPWVFTSSCTTGGCTERPCADITGPGPVGNFGGALCGCISDACPGIFNKVHCGNWAAYVYSGGPPCGGQPWAQLCNTFTLPPGGGRVTFWYAYDQAVSNQGYAEVWVDVPCASPVRRFDVILGACTSWQQGSVDLCAFGGCQVTICGYDKNAQPPPSTNGGNCGWLFLDDVQCEPCVATSPTRTNTFTITRTPTRTATATSTATATATPTVTVTSTATRTPTIAISPTATVTDTATVTRTVTSTATSTVCPTLTASRTETRTVTATATTSVCPTATRTPSVCPTTTATRTATATHTATFTDSTTATASLTASGTFSPTVSFTRTFTPATGSYTSTATATRTYTESPSPTITATFTASPTATYSFTWTSTATQSFTSPPTATFTASRTATYSFTWTFTATVTATFSATFTRTETATATRTVTVTETPTFSPTSPPSDTFTVANTPSVTPTTFPPYLWVDKNVVRPSQFPVRIGWAVAGEADVRIAIFNSAAEFVREVWHGEAGNGQPHVVEWDGRNYNGNMVASNVYIVRLFAPTVLLLKRLAVAQ